MNPRHVITWVSDWDQLETSRALRDRHESNRIVPCPDCGGLRYDLGGPHAPRWLDGRRVDCLGREVRP
jgi:hypothetical protein